MLNPKYGSLGEQISSALYKSMAQMKANKKFCIEVTQNPNIIQVLTGTNAENRL